jgi:hypothetical protein
MRNQYVKQERTPFGPFGIDMIVLVGYKGRNINIHKLKISITSRDSMQNFIDLDFK